MKLAMEPCSKQRPSKNTFPCIREEPALYILVCKDYNCEGMQKQMQLPAAEFIRRFEMHILPRYFTKIRSYGYLSNRNWIANISAITVYMEIPPHPAAVKIPRKVRLLERYKIQYNQCAHCGQLSLVLVGVAFKEKIVRDG